MMPINEWNEPNCWLTNITLSDKVKPIDVMMALEAENIEPRPVWKPMHLQPVFKKCDFIRSLDNEAKEQVAATNEGQKQVEESYRYYIKRPMDFILSLLVIIILNPGRNNAYEYTLFFDSQG